ncbi:hypothetical protein HOD96_02805, partial [Candidatus Falkowbacteria bacterium]|nr:hypothetical protein [Candidatus Falkowbacteria bacterium]
LLKSKGSATVPTPPVASPLLWVIILTSVTIGSQFALSQTSKEGRSWAKTGKEKIRMGRKNNNLKLKQFMV